MGASVIARDLASVFIAMNSTPATPSLTILVTALDPPPPRPTTFILTELAEKLDLAILF
jgi:hypothetical protein